jgi:hypothetical protein
VGVLSRAVPGSGGESGDRATPWAVAWTTTSVLPATAASDLAAADTDRVVIASSPHLTASATSASAGKIFPADSHGAAAQAPAASDRPRI